MTVISFQGAPPAGGSDRERASVINRMLWGGINCTGSLTLTANDTTTTVIDSRVGANSFIGLMPTTAHAAGAIATTYIAATGKQTFTITHANDASVDKTFRYLVIG